MEKIKISSLYPPTWEENFQADNEERNANLEAYFEELQRENAEYIEDSTAKQYFDTSLASGKSNVIFLIGFSQTGKTTFLWKYFEIQQNTVRIQDKRLIVPIMGLGETEYRSPYPSSVEVLGKFRSF